MTRARIVAGALALALPLLAACRGERTQVSQQGDVKAAPAPPARYGIGHAATDAQVRAWNIDVNARGEGLPPGRGTPAEGAKLFAAKCAACHGAKGEGQAIYPKLIGREPRTGFPFASDWHIPHTIGNYWPYATTIYDYVNRAMPLTAPGSLTPNEVYALTAFLLAANEIVPQDAVIDATTLPKVKMPAHDHFVPDDRRGGADFR